MNTIETVYHDSINAYLVSDWFRMMAQTAGANLGATFLRIGLADNNRFFVQFYNEKGFITNLYWIQVGNGGYWTNSISGTTLYTFGF